MTTTQLICSTKLSAPLGKSEHELIEDKLDLSLHIINQLHPKRFNYYKGKYQLIRQELANVEWDEDLLAHDVDALWETIKSTVMGSVERHVP